MRIFPGAAADATNLTMLQSWGEYGLSCVVWGAAEVLANHLRQRGEREYWSELNILELGAGPGLSGLTASRLGAKRVVLTDRGSVLECTQRNADGNRGAASGGSSAKPKSSVVKEKAGKLLPEQLGARTLDVRPLDWASPLDRAALEAEYGVDGWDYCIGSDLVYANIVPPLAFVPTPPNPFYFH